MADASPNSAPSGSGTTAHQSSPYNPTDDSTSPYYLHPADVVVRLTGDVFNGDNYLIWSKTFVMNLKVKDKVGFLDGSLPIPNPVTHPLHFSAWHRANNLVQSWLVNFVSPTIRSSLLDFVTAQEVWDELRLHYGRSDGPRIFHLEKSLSSIKQGSQSIIVYYNTFKSLWDEFVGFRPIPKCSCGVQCTCDIHTLLVN